MTLDPAILKSLGWSDDLVDAAQRLLQDAPRPVSSPGAEALFVQPQASVTSDRVDVSDQPPVGSPELFVRT